MNRRLFLYTAALLFFTLGLASAVPSIEVSPATLLTTEGQADAFYEISLTEEPSGNVEITPMTSDQSEAQVSGPVTFTPANWMIPQKVTVTPKTDALADGDIPFTITGSVNAPGTNYESVVVPSVSGNNRNVDGVADIFIDKHQNHETTELGGTSTFLIFTSTVPTDPITIDAVISHPSEVSLSESTITLNSGNGFSTTVTITGLDDSVVDGDMPFSISFNPSNSSDGSYDGESVPSVVGVNEALPVYQPDIRISRTKRSGDGKGNDIYSAAPTGAQTLVLKKKRKRPAFFSFSVQNDGDDADMVSLRSADFFRKQRDFSIVLRGAGGARISRPGLASGIVQNLDAGGTQVYLARLKVKRRVKKKRILFSASLFSGSSNDMEKKDSARIKVKFK